MPDNYEVHIQVNAHDLLTLCGLYHTHQMRQDKLEKLPPNCSKCIRIYNHHKR